MRDCAPSAPFGKGGTITIGRKTSASGVVSLNTAVAAVTGSSGTKLITDGSGQDIFLADIASDEAGAIANTIAAAAGNEPRWASTTCK